MKKWKRIGCMLLLILHLNCMVCLAEEAGTVVLEVEVYDGFAQSVMVNLVGKSGENYLLVAEPRNAWAYDIAIPPGSYEVEYAAVDDVKQKYRLNYEKQVTVEVGKATKLHVEVHKPKIEVQAHPGQQEAQLSHRKTLREIIWGSVPSLSLIGVGLAALGWIKYRKERKDYGG